LHAHIKQEVTFMLYVGGAWILIFRCREREHKNILTRTVTLSPYENVYYQLHSKMAYITVMIEGRISCDRLSGDVKIKTYDEKKIA